MKGKFILAALVMFVLTTVAGVAQAPATSNAAPAAAKPAPAETAAPAASKEPSATAIVCTGVKDRAPEGAAEKFAATVGQLSCFSELKHFGDKAFHVWFFGDKQVAKIELAVKAERWRTWSSKKIPATAKGAWRVEVQKADGTVVATAKFAVE